jgi:alpha-tubulin suppressor-like RCC1 family protein
VIPNVRALSCGKAHALAVTCDGRVFGWGDSAYNQLGQLGLRDELDGLSRDAPPSCVECPRRCHALAAVAGHLHSVVLGACGRVFTFGDNDHGQLGHEERCAQPTGLPAREAVEVAAGCYFTLVRLRSGEVWSFGDSLRGQLGRRCWPGTWAGGAEVDGGQQLAHTAASLPVAWAPSRTPAPVFMFHCNVVKA